MIDLPASVRMRLLSHKPDDNNKDGYDIVDKCSQDEREPTHFLDAFDSDQQQQVVKSPNQAKRLDYACIVIICLFWLALFLRVVSRYEEVLLFLVEDEPLYRLKEGKTGEAPLEEELE